jgi:hypothetical protein
MTTLQERVSKRSLDFKNQRKAYLLREVKNESWESIASQLVNVSGDQPCWATVRTIVTQFNLKAGARRYKYKNCGRSAWKMTSDVQKYLIRTMLAQRCKQVVTSVSLQADLARERGDVVTDRAIRKFLNSRGYKLLPRSQKRKYTKEARKFRMVFSRAVLRMSKAALRAKLCMSLDGVILARPPDCAVERYNYIWGGETHMWRKRGESNQPALAGDDDFPHQIQPSRMIPVWGGLSEGGFAPVLWHPNRKTNQTEWAKAVRQGLLTDAIRSLKPVSSTGPFTVLCDGEKFLRAKASRDAHALKKVVLWTCPPRSPDLNPVEMFWGWLRRKLRHMDMLDLKKKRKVLGKTAYRERIKGVMRSQKAQVAAKAFAGKLRGACKQVVQRRGAAADN